MSAPRATASVQPSGQSPGLQRVALKPAALGQGLPAAPGCAESAPLFRSHMPRLIGWRPVEAEMPQQAPEAAPEAEEVQPAMHQALHLCVVERFQPQRPFGGASKALYRL